MQDFQENKMEKENEIKIRPEKFEDIKDILYVTKQTWLDTYPNEKYGVKKAALEQRFSNKGKSLKRFEKSFKERQNKEGSFSLVAEINNQIVGFTHVKDKNTIAAIYVLPEHQKKGVGDSLMKNILDFCKDSKEIFVETAIYNEKAINFYKKFGFKSIPNSEDKHDRGDNISIPTIKMKLELIRKNDI